MTGLVYTAVFGGYDRPRPVTVKEDGVSYIMFTDGPGADGWERWGFDRPNSPQRKARFHKVFGGPTSNHDWSVWIDGNFEIERPIVKLVEDSLNEHDFAAFKHPWWNCSYTEADKCARLRKDTLANMKRVSHWLNKKKFPKQHGQLATGVLMRKHSPLAKEHAEKWWKTMQRFTMRDQCLFMFHLWRLKASIRWLPGSHLSNPWFKFHKGHG